MNPHAATGKEIFGNPLRDRVTACRKRLRVSRSAQRTSNTEVDPAIPDAAVAQFPADSSPVRQLVSLDLSPSFGDKNGQNSSDPGAVQEVGIT